MKIAQERMVIMTGTWKHIDGFYGYYVSRQGTVSDGKRLLPLQTSRGYHQVHLKDKNGKWHTFKVSRLVAKAFIPNPENKPYVNHIDGNRGNDNVDNLEWCTPSENIRHSIYVLGNTHVLKNNWRKVICVETQEVFESLTAAADWLCVDSSNIGDCCKYKNKTCRSFHFEYTD